MVKNTVLKVIELKQVYNDYLDELEKCKLSKEDRKSLETIIKGSIAHESITLDHIQGESTSTFS